MRNEETPMETRCEKKESGDPKLELGKRFACWPKTAASATYLKRVVESGLLLTEELVSAMFGGLYRAHVAPDARGAMVRKQPRGAAQPDF